MNLLFNSIIFSYNSNYRTAIILLQIIHVCINNIPIFINDYWSFQQHKMVAEKWKSDHIRDCVVHYLWQNEPCHHLCKAKHVPQHAVQLLRHLNPLLHHLAALHKLCAGENRRRNEQLHALEPARKHTGRLNNTANNVLMINLFL